MNASYKTAIQFQDLYIPVKMFKVYHDNSIELNQLCKDSKERVRYIKFCPSCKKEITNSDIIRGYEYAEDKYVILEQSDIESITSEKDRTLSIEYFCKAKELSTLLIDKSYYLIPEMESEMSYELLRKSMITNRVVGIAEIVLGTKQELVALFPDKLCIIATILFYEDEINDLPIITKRKTDKQQLDNLRQKILNNVKDFNWNSHYDKYQLKIRELIFKKIPR